MMQLDYTEIISVRILYEETQQSDYKFWQRIINKYVYKLVMHRCTRFLIWSKSQLTSVYKNNFCDFAEFALASSYTPNHRVNFYGIYVERLGTTRYILIFNHNDEEYKIDTYEPLDLEPDKFYEEHPVIIDKTKTSQREYVDGVDSDTLPYYELMVDAIVKFLKGEPNDTNTLQ